MNTNILIIISMLLVAISCNKEATTEIFDTPLETKKIIKTTVYEPINNDGELICGKRIKHPFGEDIGLVFYDSYNNIVLEKILDEQDSLIRQIKTEYYDPEGHKKALVYSKFIWSNDIEKEEYVRNQSGQLIEIKKNQGDSKDKVTHAFNYDDQGRIIKEVYGGTTEIKTYNPSPKGTYIVNIQTYTDGKITPESLSKEETIVVNEVNNNILKRFTNTYEFGVVTKSTEIINSFNEAGQLTKKIERIKQIPPEVLHTVPLELDPEESEKLRKENIMSSTLSYSKENEYVWVYNKYGECINEVSPIEKIRRIFEYNQFGDWTRCIIYQTTFELDISLKGGYLSGGKKIEVEKPICIIDRNITYLNK